MKRDQYLAHGDVSGFVQWASGLVRGELGLEHRWKGKGPAFRCSTLYEAFQGYLWPNSLHGDRFADTVRKFDRFHETFEDIGAISKQGRHKTDLSLMRRLLPAGAVSTD